jgi:hypothetical protein
MMVMVPVPIVVPVIAREMLSAPVLSVPMIRVPIASVKISISDKTLAAVESLAVPIADAISAADKSVSTPGESIAAPGKRSCDATAPRRDTIAAISSATAMLSGIDCRC